MCGLLSVTLPPLGLPILYFATVIVESIGGSPYTSSRWSNPPAVMAVVKIFLLTTVGCLVAGAPLGVAGWLRRERMRWLTVLGMALSAGTLGYFLTVMHFFA